MKLVALAAVALHGLASKACFFGQQKIIAFSAKIFRATIPEELNEASDLKDSEGMWVMLYNVYDFILFDYVHANA